MSASEQTDLPAWIREKNGEVTLSLRATPRASRSEISGVEDDWLKVRLKAPPVDGKANKELISFFAKLLKLPKKSIRICSGESSRLKAYCHQRSHKRRYTQVNFMKHIYLIVSIFLFSLFLPAERLVFDMPEAHTRHLTLAETDELSPQTRRLPCNGHCLRAGN